MQPWRFITAISMGLVFFMGQVDAKPGKGGGKPGGEEPSPVTSCADKASVFPAFAFSRFITNKRGRTSGFEIVLANADGDCNVVIYSSDSSSEGDLDLSYRQIGIDGTIVWRQNANENIGRKDPVRSYDNIRIVRFQASNKEVTSSLPLSASVLKTTGNGSDGMNSIDLSPDGTKVAYSFYDGTTGASQGIYINEIREMDIANCSSNCSNSTLYSWTEGFITGLSYSPFGDRVYFASGFTGNPSNPLNAQSFIAFIETQAGTWSTPRLLTLEGNGLYGTDFSGGSTFRDPDVAFSIFGAGATEVVAFSIYDRDAGQFKIQVIDVGSCSATGTGDCISSGESFVLVSKISNAKYSTFDSISNASSLICSSSTADDIFRYDLDFGTTAVVAIGAQADSAD